MAELLGRKEHGGQTQEASATGDEGTVSVEDTSRIPYPFSANEGAVSFEVDP